MRQFLTLTAAALALSACHPPSVGAGGAKGKGGLDQDALNAAIDASMGSPDTCVEIADTQSGAELYRYGSNGACLRRLPPCSTFKIANTLIGLDAGAATPTTVFKWDHTPQPVKSWEVDADLKTAFENSIVWVYQRIAAKVGHDAYVERLKAFDYGNKDPAGPVTWFWLGPAKGGGLAISTREQAEFLHRLYTGKLPVKPESLAFVQEIMVNEIRSGPEGQAIMSGKTGSCQTQADQSRSVGWWVGRLKTPSRDVVFAASIEGAEAPPGLEVQAKIKSAFAKANLWPAG